MLDTLIMAYRAQIYDWNFSKWIDFCNKNKRLVIGLGIFVLIIVISIVACIKVKSSLLIFIILLGEGIAAIYIDRHMVKKYRRYLTSTQNHLDKTVSFLKTALPGIDLFGDKQIDELTVRLTKRIESTIPYTKFVTGLSNFTKAIILPIITYVAGIYSGNIGKLDFETVTIWAITAVLVLGTIKFTWSGISTILRTITCRNHDAAIAFREDLMDIKLLQYVIDKN